MPTIIVVDGVFRELQASTLTIPRRRPSRASWRRRVAERSAGAFAHPEACR
jgi:hypothetical protein